MTVNLDDCYRFFLQSENCTPYDEYIRFEKGLAQFPYPASFEVDVNEQIYLKEEVLDMLIFRDTALKCQVQALFKE